MGCKTVGRFVYDSAEAQAVAEGGSLAYTSATASNNCVRDAGRGVVSVQKPGIYNVSVNAVLEAVAAGPVGLRLRHNGVAVPGAAGAVTLGAAGDLATVAFSTPVTVRCCAGDVLDVVADAATSATVAAMVVERAA